MIVSYACPICSTFVTACCEEPLVVGSAVCPGCDQVVVLENAKAPLKDKIRVSQYPLDLIALLGDGYERKET